MPNVSDGTACPVRRWFNNMPPVRHLPRPLATRRPAHNSINAFRKRFLGELGDLFTQILLRAYGLGVLRLGDVSLDGTKIHANASKHKALSWGYANRLEEQLREEVDELLKKAGAPAATASAVIRMRHRLKTAEGKAVYARRKSTVEPVFGIIKQVMGFRQFLLRGLKAVTGEWTLVCIAYNLKRLHVLAG